MDTIKNFFSNENQERLHWGSAFALWEICRSKIIGIPMLDLLVDHVNDTELKTYLEVGIEHGAIPHVEKVQKFLKDHDQTYPPLQQRKNIDDQQIARILKEMARLSVYHDSHALVSTASDDERNLIWNILSDDKKAFDRIVALNRKNGWLLNPPNV